MHTRRTHAVLSLSGLALLLTGAALYAGPLNPPAGVVTPTSKTLTEVEPRTAINAANTPGTASTIFRISQPGSYYLTGNILGASGKNGIEIFTSGVTIDLNGFDVQGVGGSLDGVVAINGSLNNITIFNGSIRNWAGDGIDLATNFAANTVVRDVQAMGNTGVGIRAGSTFILERCSARGNLSGGFTSGSQGFATNCEAIGNSATGMVMGQGTSVRGCTASFNLGSADGIVISGFGGSVLDCTASSNAANGIVVNTGFGTLVSRCSTSNNTLSGIQAAQGTSVSGCSSNFNQTFNIIAASGCIVENCTVQFGNLGGIRCDTKCIIRGNMCDSNSNGGATGPNILVTGVDNRVEGNNCTGAFRGIKVDSAGNFITRNTCSGSANNYELVAGNVCLVVGATSSGAILGSTGGVSPGSTDPNANFAY